MGLPNYAKGILEHSKAQEARAIAQNTPAKLAESLLAAKLANKINQPKADRAYEITDADLRNTIANTGLTNSNTFKQNILNKFLPQREQTELRNLDSTTGLNTQNTLKQKILNQYLPEREPAEIAEANARAHYYANGGGSGGVGSKDAANFESGVGRDNPHLTPEQLQEAVTVTAKGGNQLSDGTKLNPMSFGTEQALNRAIRSGTTAGQINQSNLANQADAELDVFSNLASKWGAPYSDTVLGKSPQQILDTFKKDDKSQTQLGELIASNALQYEISQIRNRISGGHNGITSTKMLMDEAKQHINTMFPRMSAKTKQVANDRLNEAVKSALEARNKLGVGAANTYRNQYVNSLNNNLGTNDGSANNNTEPSEQQVETQLKKQEENLKTKEQWDFFISQLTPKEYAVFKKMHLGDQ